MEDQRVGRDPSEIDQEWAILRESWRMSKGERLHRWAELLELEEEQPLRLVDGTDTGSRADERGGRADNSPLTVAFEDWALRAEGLQSDCVTDAAEFFELAEDEVKSVVAASDHGRRTIPAPAAAERVRRLAFRAERAPLPPAGMFAAGASVAVAVALVLVVL
jgi:hypothetical protein